MTQSQPPITRTTHTLPFDKHSPRDFERLCPWLVEREGYERAEYLPIRHPPCRCCRIMVKYLLEVIGIFDIDTSRLFPVEVD